MNVTLNSDTVAILIYEVEDILSHGDISCGTSDDLSCFLNALMELENSGSIVIVPNDDNIGDDWDDDDFSPDPVNGPLMTA